jgi:choline dehydrogenase
MLRENYLQSHGMCFVNAQVMAEFKRRDNFTYGFPRASSLSRPKSRGTLQIQSTDPFNYPAIDPHYLEHLDDIKVLIQGNGVLS